MPRDEKIGIVGSGFIGRSWAMLFAGVGYQVYMYDNKPKQVTGALEDILQQLKDLETSGLLRGTASAEEQYKYIKGVASLKECVTGAKFIQEAVFEDAEVKKEVFKQIDELVDSKTIISSSTSCIVPSILSADLTHRANFIVSHPVNPPYYVPMVEVVPAPWTSKDVVAQTKAIMIEIGQAPVMFAKEQPGFGANRIQYAILNECKRLVENGVLSAEGVDIMMKDGFAYRYAWMGPLETAALNANGMKDYLERYGSTIESVSKELSPLPSWKVENSGEFLRQIDEMVPLDKLKERRAWRDARLAAIAKLKKDMKELEKSGK